MKEKFTFSKGLKPADVEPFCTEIGYIDLLIQISSSLLKIVTINYFNGEGLEADRKNLASN